MRIVEPHIEFWSFDPVEVMGRLELAGRVCYKSEDRIKRGSDVPFLNVLVKRGHESVLEHCSITAKFVVDRGVSHEIVRHRIGAYSQESTRYCRYEEGITVIRPLGRSADDVRVLEECERVYLLYLASGVSPQNARWVLPTALKTEVIATYNIRQWRHVLKRRCSSDNHPQMQQVMIPALLFLRHFLPVLFEDIPYNEDFPQADYAKVW